MRPDRAVRLAFSAATAVGKATLTQPDTVGASLQHVTATIESASRRVSEGDHPPNAQLTFFLLLLLLLPYRVWQRSEPSVYSKCSLLVHAYVCMCSLFTFLLQVGRSMPPRLVAVSKGQPVYIVQEAYSYGARHFGENYVSVHTLCHFFPYPICSHLFSFVRCKSYEVKLKN